MEPFHQSLSLNKESGCKRKILFITYTAQKQKSGFFIKMSEFDPGYKYDKAPGLIRMTCRRLAEKVGIPAEESQAWQEAHFRLIRSMLLNSETIGAILGDKGVPAYDDVLEHLWPMGANDQRDKIVSTPVLKASVDMCYRVWEAMAQKREGTTQIFSPDILRQQAQG